MCTYTCAYYKRACGHMVAICYDNYRALNMQLFPIDIPFLTYFTVTLHGATMLQVIIKYLLNNVTSQEQLR